ncbi:MAG: hypothetical protein WDN03_08465 [Rhizomicrobium sp.]
MKTIIASIFAPALMGAGAADASVGAGIHVGGVGIGAGVHAGHGHRSCHSWGYRQHRRHCRR